MSRSVAVAVVVNVIAAACGGQAAPNPPARAAPSPAVDARPAVAPCDRVVASFETATRGLVELETAPRHQAALRDRLAAFRTILADECSRWPASLVDCFGAATTEAAWGECEATVPPELQEAMQARLDAVPPPPEDDADRLDRARRRAQKIAFEYYPQWAVEPQHRGCPASLAELAPYAGPGETWADPWGTAFTTRCEGGMLIVVSAGPDRQPGTADDVTSAD